MKKILATLSVLLGATLVLAGCSGQDPVELSSDTVIIDVRTPAEFASGHLEGAVNIDVQSPDFAQQIMALDKDGEYFVYCRSGNRSGAAISQMAQMGFDTNNIVNGGSVEQASNMSNLDVVIP